MVMYMKKYILLLFLFFVYIILSINNNKTTLVSVQNSNSSVDVLDIEFVKGINSNNLKNILEKYKYDYLINKFFLNKNEVTMKCNNISNCIDDFLSTNYNDNYYDYLLNGFKIKKISIVTYKKEFIRLLKDNDVAYIIK